MHSLWSKFGRHKKDKNTKSKTDEEVVEWYGMMKQELDTTFWQPAENQAGHHLFKLLFLFNKICSEVFKSRVEQRNDCSLQAGNGVSRTPAVLKKTD